MRIDMITKKCSKCGEEKALNSDNFYPCKNKWRAACKSCTQKSESIYYQTNKAAINEQHANYYQNNKERLTEVHAEYYQNNKEVISEQSAEYYQANKEEIKINQAKYYQENKDEIKKRHSKYNAKPETKKIKNANVRKRRQTEPHFKLRDSVRIVIGAALKKQEASKDHKSCLKYLPYTIEELKTHLESKFEDWMNWENWGKYDVKTWNDLDPTTWTWQIDHKIPHADFHYTSMEDESFKECWALDNLRPYSAKQNILDGTSRIRHKKNKLA
jgi:hypothetical protein